MFRSDVAHFVVVASTEGKEKKREKKRDGQREQKEMRKKVEEPKILCKESVPTGECASVSANVSVSVSECRCVACRTTLTLVD